MQAKNKDNLDILEIFSNNLRFSRNNAGLSREKFAEKIGLTGPTQISHYETGKNLPNVRTLVKIAEVLNVDIHWLITGQPSPGAGFIEKTLKPFVLAHLNDVLAKMQGLEAERMELIRKQAAGEVHAVRLDEIQEDTTNLHMYYKAALKHLDDPLKSVNLKAELKYDVTPEEAS